MYLFFVALQIYNVIADLHFNKSVLSNVSFVKTFCCWRCYWNTGMCFLCHQWFFLSTFGRPSRSTREIIKEFWKRPCWNASGPSGGLLMAPILGYEISTDEFKLEVLLSRTTQILLQTNKQTNKQASKQTDLLNSIFVRVQQDLSFLLHQEFPCQEHHQGFRQLPRPGGANHWFATSWVKALKGEWFSV